MLLQISFHHVYDFTFSVKTYALFSMHGESVCECVMERCVVKLFGDSGASAFFGGAALLRHFFIWEDHAMNLYENLYYKLFAVIADAVESLEQNEPCAAQKALIAAMRDAEEAVVSAEG